MGRRRVGIIGAGVTGLVALKEALAEGLDAVAFEQRPDVGGLWFRQDPKEQEFKPAARAYLRLVQNSVKDFFAYSDFPQAEATPLLPRAEDVKAYLDAYTEHFNLRPRIHLSATVLGVEKAASHAEDGRWSIRWMDEATRAEKTEIFDGVILASGYYSSQRWPELPGREAFKGSVIHSGDLHDPDEYRDKRVGIIGSGISGVDITSLLATRAAQVYLLSRQGCHVIPQWISPGKSFEWLFYDRAFNEESKPEEAAAKWDQVLAEHFDFASIGLAPEKPVFQGAVAVSSDIDNCIYSGQVKVVRGEVERLDAAGLKVTTESEPIQLDAVICCTGYRCSLPFLDEAEIMGPEGLAGTEWWQHIFPVHQSHPSLFTLGLMYQTGPYPALVEMEARAAAGILSGRLSLPSKEAMLCRIQQEKEAHKSIKGCFPAFINAHRYTMELSRFVGCFPELEAIGKRCGELASACARGPVIPAHYRLLGHGSDWDLAQRTILNLRDPSAR